MLRIVIVVAPSSKLATGTIDSELGKYFFRREFAVLQSGALRTPSGSSAEELSMAAHRQFAKAKLWVGIEGVSIEEGHKEMAGVIKGEDARLFQLPAKALEVIVDLVRQNADGYPPQNDDGKPILH